MVFYLLFRDATASLKHFLHFFFNCCLILEIMHIPKAAFHHIQDNHSRRVSLSKKEASMGSGRNVLRNVFQSVFHPHKWEWNQCSLPQMQSAEFDSDPRHLHTSRFHNRENRMCRLFNMDHVK